jgi:HK97 family phage major capsid protein
MNKLTERMFEINNRKAEIRSDIENKKEGIDLNALETELNSLNTEFSDIEKRMKLTDSIKIEKPDEKENDNMENRTNKDKEIAEQRGKDLKEMRSVKIGTSDFIVPKYTSSDVKQTFNPVSSIVDAVTVKPLVGGESYEQAYVDSYGEGEYSTTGGDYTDTETVFKYASIAKTKITAYQEEPEEISKLSNIDYDAEISNGVRTALRKKLAKQILVGDGAAGHVTGIFSDKATAIDTTTDLKISNIDENTLDDIIFSYGGDENVEDGAVLIINRKDLKAFAKVKGADKRRAYDIVLNGNTGTINSIPFIISSACGVLSDSAATADTYCMAYGSLSNYMLTIFSDIDIQRSTDYKFKQGMICHKGNIFVGGNVVAKNGFIRVKKVAA